MPDSSPTAHRALKTKRCKLQDGIVLSCTVLRHPPARFGPRPRPVALIALEDGARVLAPLTQALPIGTHVRSRLRLSHITAEGLRIYDATYEPLVLSKNPVPDFPGYILALTGPSGVGKSTVSAVLMRMFAEYVERVPIVTTRERREGDDGEYRYVSKRVFTELQKEGKLIAMTHIPATAEERWYGYRASDLERIWKAGKLPVVITEMHLLQGLAERYGRRSILSFGLLPPGKSKRAMLSHLLHRLRLRGRETEEHIKDRLKNAEEDIAFFSRRKDLFDRILVNENVEHVIENLRQTVPGLSEARTEN
ncbi:MAG: OB-fold domain-containing protein [Candidatus Peribacteraceae bacterium]